MEEVWLNAQLKYSTFNGYKLPNLQQARVEKKDWLDYMKDSLRIFNYDRIYDNYEMDSLENPYYTEPKYILKLKENINLNKSYKPTGTIVSKGRIVN
jgi:hypothetical protein